MFGKVSMMNDEMCFPKDKSQMEHLKFWIWMVNKVDVMTTLNSFIMFFFIEISKVMVY